MLAIMWAIMIRAWEASFIDHKFNFRMRLPSLAIQKSNHSIYTVSIHLMSFMKKAVAILDTTFGAIWSNFNN
jgi:hypothetical protein